MEGFRSWWWTSEWICAGRSKQQSGGKKANCEEDAVSFILVLFLRHVGVLRWPCLCSSSAMLVLFLCHAGALLFLVTARGMCKTNYLCWGKIKAYQEVLIICPISMSLSFFIVLGSGFLSLMVATISLLSTLIFMFVIFGIHVNIHVGKVPDSWHTAGFFVWTAVEDVLCLGY